MSYISLSTLDITINTLTFTESIIQINKKNTCMYVYRCKEFESPISERPSSIKHDLGKTTDACTVFITTDMNGYPDVR